MASTNYRINKIEGVRTAEIASSVEVKSNFAILSVKKDKNPNLGVILDAAFRFEVGYEPDIGSMKIEGNILYSEEGLEKKITEKKDMLKLDSQIVNALTTSIVRESLLEVIDLSKKLRLPVPIRLPSIEMKPTKLEFKKAA